MDVLMPQLGETVAEGRILKWFKAEGDPVLAGENLCEIETDKVTIEVPALSPGVLARIAVREGDIAPVGTVIAVVAAPGEAMAASPRLPLRPEPGPVTVPAPAPPPAASTPPLARAARPMLPPAAASPAPRHEPDLFREVRTPPRNFGPAQTAKGAVATPLARRLAGEAGIDLAAVAGSGPHGRITGRDVEARIAARPVPALDRAETFEEFIGKPHPNAPQAERRINGMRGPVPRTRPDAVVPHLVIATHLLVDPMLKLRDDINAGAPLDAAGRPAFRIAVTDMIACAWALALRATPRANVVWSNSAILELDQADVAVAVATGSGLLAPVVRAVDTKSLSAVSAEIADLSARARTGTLADDDCRGGSTTLADLGLNGIVALSAIVSPPRSTILAIGAPERVAVEASDGAIAFASRITATLSCDHRMIDEVLAADLLAAFRRLVEAPLRILL